MKINVIAHPNCKNPRIEKDLLGTVHVYVKEPPQGGKANVAVLKALASYIKTAKSNIELISGYKSKNKIFEVTQDQERNLS